MADTSPVSDSLLDSIASGLIALGVDPKRVETFVAEVIALINKSDTLKAEIHDLTGNLFSPNWTFELALAGYNTATYVEARTIQISVDPAQLDVADFVGRLAYELGHAEDKQLNTILYSGNTLAWGAYTALTRTA